ncbi:hypothetical protein RirG_171440 [Rhizophagus irregularis DAOM 197198w]|uniref:Uncharacterized protein n=1 Tax=Rhizophagus irregularis (strain DAOM 197198w) TaxID=1432141 RepID=A0A015K1Z4_RHIIW|nr:hypothetical protein RirG_171440 [Rhizophagus irregularis DAOM 197198w]
MDVLVTKTFIDKVQEIKEMDEEEKELKIKEWLERETVICRRCGNRRFEMNKMDSECEECIQEMQKDEQDELAELKDELEKLGYEVDVSEIRRIKGFGVNNRIMITKEFIKEYMKIIDLEDKEVRKEIHKWLNENTTWCEGCEIRWMNNMFRLGETICEDCKEKDIDEMDDRVRRLKKIFEDMGIIMIEGELLRLISMGYTDGEILDKEFIEIFRENKNESEKELKKKLDKLLKEQAGISAISNALRKELNIPIIKKSNVVLTIADGKNIASLGIAEIEIEIQEDLGITLEVEVIDSKQKELILRTNLLKYGILDMREGMLTIELNNEIYEKPIDYNGRKDVSFEESESETESDTEEKDNEINDSSEESGDEYEEIEQEELFSFVKNNGMKKKNKVK